MAMQKCKVMDMGLLGLRAFCAENLCVLKGSTLGIRTYFQNGGLRPKDQAENNVSLYSLKL
jgi:hypothetical protein